MKIYKISSINKGGGIYLNNNNLIILIKSILIQFTSMSNAGTGAYLLKNNIFLGY